MNHEMVLMGEPDAEDRELPLVLLREHRDRTMSLQARTIVAKWEWYRPLFRKVEPRGASAHIASIRREYMRRYVLPVAAAAPGVLRSA